MICILKKNSSQKKWILWEFYSKAYEAWIYMFRSVYPTNMEDRVRNVLLNFLLVLSKYVPTCMAALVIYLFFPLQTWVPQFWPTSPFIDGMTSPQGSNNQFPQNSQLFFILLVYAPFNSTHNLFFSFKQLNLSLYLSLLVSSFDGIPWTEAMGSIDI